MTPAPDELACDAAGVHEQAWADHFAPYGITPWMIDYEDLVDDVDGAVASALSYLGIDAEVPPSARLRLVRRADEVTERWVAEYEDAVASGALDHVEPTTQVPRT